MPEASLDTCLSEAAQHSPSAACAASERGLEEAWLRFGADRCEALTAQLRSLCPLVDEANELTRELMPGQGLQLEIVPCCAALDSVDTLEAEGPLDISELTAIRVIREAEGEHGQLVELWTVDKFMERLQLMRGLYEELPYSCRRPWSEDPLVDPWRDPSLTELWSRAAQDLERLAGAEPLRVRGGCCLSNGFACLGARSWSDSDDYLNNSSKQLQPHYIRSLEAGDSKPTSGLELAVSALAGMHCDGTDGASHLRERILTKLQAENSQLRTDLARMESQQQEWLNGLGTSCGSHKTEELPCSKHGPAGLTNSPFRDATLPTMPPRSPPVGTRSLSASGNTQILLQHQALVRSYSTSSLPRSIPSLVAHQGSASPPHGPSRQASGVSRQDSGVLTPLQPHDPELCRSRSSSSLPSVTVTVATAPVVQNREAASSCFVWPHASSGPRISNYAHCLAARQGSSSPPRNPSRQSSVGVMTPVQLSCREVSSSQFVRPHGPSGSSIPSHARSLAMRQASPPRCPSRQTSVTSLQTSGAMSSQRGGAISPKRGGSPILIRSSGSRAASPQGRGSTEVTVPQHGHRGPGSVLAMERRSPKGSASPTHSVERVLSSVISPQGGSGDGSPASGTSSMPQVGSAPPQIVTQQPMLQGVLAGSPLLTVSQGGISTVPQQMLVSPGRSVSAVLSPGRSVSGVLPVLRQVSLSPAGSVSSPLLVLHQGLSPPGSVSSPLPLRQRSLSPAGSVSSPLPVPQQSLSPTVSVSSPLPVLQQSLSPAGPVVAPLPSCQVDSRDVASLEHHLTQLEQVLQGGSLSEPLLSPAGSVRAMQQAKSVDTPEPDLQSWCPQRIEKVGVPSAPDSSQERMLPRWACAPSVHISSPIQQPRKSTESITECESRALGVLGPQRGAPSTLDPVRHGGSAVLPIGGPGVSSLARPGIAVLAGNTLVRNSSQQELPRTDVAVMVKSPSQVLQIKRADSPSSGLVRHSATQGPPNGLVRQSSLMELSRTDRSVMARSPSQMSQATRADSPVRLASSASAVVMPSLVPDSMIRPVVRAVAVGEPQSRPGGYQSSRAMMVSPSVVSGNASHRGALSPPRPASTVAQWQRSAPPPQVSTLARGGVPLRVSLKQTSCRA